MIYYINSYAEDAEMLALCTARVRELDPDARIFIANDPERPLQRMPEGCEELHRFTPRNGNLNGVNFIRDQLNGFRTVMELTEADYIVKMDSDAWLNAVDWLQVSSENDADLLFLERQIPLKVNGTCYRISKTAVDTLILAIGEREWPQGYNCPEDDTTYLLALRSGLHVQTIPYTEGCNAGLHASLPTERHARAWCVHCGEPLSNGTRCPREMALLRMRVLAHALKNNTQK